MPVGQAMQVIGSAPARPTLSQSANIILDLVGKCHAHMGDIERRTTEPTEALPAPAIPVGIGMKLEYAMQGLAELEKRLSGLIDILGEGETI